MEETATEEQNVEPKVTPVVEFKDESKPEVKGENDSSVTLDGIRTVVSDVVDSSQSKQDAAISDLGTKVNGLGDAIKVLSENQDKNENSADEVVYVVRLDSSQVDTAKAATRVACTEGLILIILLALSCGLQAWRVLSGRWSSG